jgi:hypothetical protein
MADTIKREHEVTHSMAGGGVVDRVPHVRGALRVVSRNVKTAEQEVVVEDHNVVVNGSKTQLARLLGAGDATRYIKWIQLGSGITPETVTDTSLEQPITPMKVVAYAYPDASPTSFRVTFTAYLEEDEANGFPISEAGLVCADNKLFSRKTFATHTKDNEHIFEFTWTLTVS